MNHPGASSQHRSAQASAAARREEYEAKAKVLAEERAAQVRELQEKSKALAEERKARVREQHLVFLPPTIALLARGRFRVGEEAPVFADGEKRKQTHINLQTTRHALIEACVWHARCAPTVAIATDGGRDVYRNSEGLPVTDDLGHGIFHSSAALSL